MKKKFLVGILAGTLFLSWGCQQQAEEAAAGDETEIAEAAEESSSTSSSTSTRSAKPKPKSKPKPKLVPTFTVPAGTTVSIRLMDPLDSGQNAVGDAFAGTLSAALKVGNQVVAPVGTTTSKALQLNLLGNPQGIVHLDAKIAHGALQFGVTE